MTTQRHTTEATMNTLTVYQQALADLGHTFTQTIDGSWDVEANPARAGQYGEITEEDHEIAQAAAQAAYDAGERRRSVIGVTFIGQAALCDCKPVPQVGSWPQY
jgi:hypothetical protein